MTKVDPKQRSKVRWFFVVLVIVVIVVVATDRSGSKGATTYTKDQAANFALIARGDPVVAPLLRADPAELVKTAEDSCTYLSDGHSEADLLNNLESTGNATSSVSQSLAYDSELAFCPNFIGH